MNCRFKKRNQAAADAKGFSLIEMVGVLTIIAVIAAAAGPSLIKQVDYSAKTTERALLSSMTNAAVRTCLFSNQIPDAANLPGAIAVALNCSISQVTTTPRGFTRRFVMDPSAAVNGSPLPYSQITAGATARPANARAVILSTIAKALPAITPNATQFNEIWNAPADTIPSVLSAWGGRGEDLQIERIDYGWLFNKVLLQNIDPTPDAIPNQGFFQIEGYGIIYLSPATAPFLAYYLDGTQITLYRSGGTSSDADTREIVHGDISFLYQNHKWSRRLTGSDDVVGGFGELATSFLKPPAPSDPKFKATQQAVVNLTYSFLWGFAAWANGDTSSVTNAAGGVVSPAVPPYAGAGGPQAVNYPSYSVVSEAQVNLATFTDNLIH